MIKKTPGILGFRENWLFPEKLSGVYLFIGYTVANNIHFDCIMFHGK